MKFSTNSQNIGSMTAINGFRNEIDISDKFNNWKNDIDAQQWLTILNYKLEDIEKVVACKFIAGFKPDIQVQVTIYFKKIIEVQNISIKLVSNSTGYNQIDKRWVDSYKELWSIPDNISRTLKIFTGEIQHGLSQTKDPRRLYLDEFDLQKQNELLRFFYVNKVLVVSDILMGRKHEANWMMVTNKIDSVVQWTLQPMNLAMQIFSEGEITISPKGSLKIGRITMQRKGGDAGRETAKQLQFKINPMDLFF